MDVKNAELRVCSEKEWEKGDLLYAEKKPEEKRPVFVRWVEAKAAKEPAVAFKN